MNENILKDYKIFDIDPAKLRHKNFFKNMQDYAKEMLSRYSHTHKPDDKFSCPLCKETIGNLFLSYNEYKLIQCNYCQLVSPNVEFDALGGEEVYDDPEYIKNTTLEILSTYDYRKNKYAPERLSYILEKMSGITRENMNLLDLGCGPGYFVSHLNDQQIKYKGLELADFLVNICKQQKLNVEKAMLENEKSGTYNVITMFDVIEHLTDPVSLFRVLNDKLAEGGYVLAYTPSIHSLAYYLMGNQQNTLAPFQHLGFYNKTSLNYLAEQTNFQVFSIDYYGLDVMDYFYQKAYEDNYNYHEKLHQFISVMQAIIDKQELSNHMRVIFKKN